MHFPPMPEKASLRPSYWEDVKATARVNNNLLQIFFGEIVISIAQSAKFSFKQNLEMNRNNVNKVESLSSSLWKCARNSIVSFSQRIGMLGSWFQIFVGRRVKVLTGCKLWNVTNQIIITYDGLLNPKLVKNWRKNLGVCAHLKLNDEKELKDNRGVMNNLYILLFLLPKLHMYQHYKLHKVNKCLAR